MFSTSIGALTIAVAAQSAVVGVVAAPEIDPASAASALMLLAGGLLVLQGRRSRQ